MKVERNKTVEERRAQILCDKRDKSFVWNNSLPNFTFLFLYSRRLEVAGERENGRARGRHARGEGAPARKAPENRFNSHSVSADISNWSRGSQGKN